MDQETELTKKLKELRQVMEKPNIRPLVSQEQLWFNVAELIQVVTYLNKEIEDLREKESHDLNLIRLHEHTINKLEQRIIELERQSTTRTMNVGPRSE